MYQANAWDNNQTAEAWLSNVSTEERFLKFKNTFGNYSSETQWNGCFSLKGTSDKGCGTLLSYQNYFIVPPGNST
jgi:hypothetical protein